MGTFAPDSRVPLIESIPTDDTTKSKECTTRGNRIKPDGSAKEKNVIIRSISRTHYIETHQNATIKSIIHVKESIQKKTESTHPKIIIKDQEEMSFMLYQIRLQINMSRYKIKKVQTQNC